MGRYIAKRTGISLVLLLFVSLLTFVLVHLSATDPAEEILHAQGVPQITVELVEQVRAELGMDRPLPVQYFRWLTACLRFDFGDSYVTGEPVWNALGPALLNTLKLTLASMTAIVALSMLLGVACAFREGRMLDRSVRVIFFFLSAMPPYWLGALLVWYFAVKLDALPTSGMTSDAGYVLPVIVLTAGYAGIYFRIVRSSMLGQLNEDYVSYARACGLPERKIRWRVLRNSLQVAVTVFGMAVPNLLGSTVVVENVFAWPGVGRLSIDAIVSRDYPMIQAYVVVLAIAFVGFNALSDMVAALLSPKLRREA